MNTGTSFETRRHNGLKDREPHLVDTVQELQEDGGEAAALAAQRLRPPVAESVPERQPLLLHQQPEAVEGPVVGVRQQLHQRHHLQACREVASSSAVSGGKNHSEGAVDTNKGILFLTVCFSARFGLFVHTSPQLLT